MIQVNKGICPHDHICPLIKACPVGAIPQDSEGFPVIDFHPLHRERQMREKMPYEGNGQIGGDNR